MLNLTIAMLKHLLISLAVFLAQAANISIASPQPGDVLRGQVEIVGNMDVPNFSSAELAFSYASNPADSWFVIQTFPQPVNAERPVIAIWDTTVLTDGDYILHLRVLLQDGSSQDVVISDLKIRNDEPLPTLSPVPTFPSQFSTPLPALTAQPVTVLPTFPSPTPLPVNPASVTSASIYSNFARGALITLVLFAFFALTLRLRKN
jgi:hypothetical protein